jgi:hypothetical protein
MDLFVVPTIGFDLLYASRGEIVEALVIADVVIVLDEGVDLPFEVAGHRHIRR